MFRNLALAAILFAAPASTLASVLTFDGLGLSNNQPIPQTYGDNMAGTPQITVAYRELDDFGNATVYAPDLHFWQSGYGDLSGVAWGSAAIETNVAEIAFTAESGYLAVLQSFDLAGWAGDRPGRSVRIYDDSYNLLASYGPMTILGGNGHSSFAPNVAASQLRLQWDFPWGVAADNITFAQSQEVIPEPASFVMMAIGLLGWLGYRQRRRAC